MQGTETAVDIATGILIGTGVCIVAYGFFMERLSRKGVKLTGPEAWLTTRGKRRELNREIGKILATADRKKES